MLVLERNKNLQPTGYSNIYQKPKKSNTPDYAQTASRAALVDTSALKAYYLNPAKISFGRTTAEHTSWGAVYNKETRETTFKFYSYPGHEVNVLVSKEKKPIRFDEMAQSDNFIRHEMSPVIGTFRAAEKDSPGTYSSATLSEVKPGDQYCFEVIKKDGTKVYVPDPYSFKQPGVFNCSRVVEDPYKHNIDPEWNKNPARIVRNQRVIQVIDGQEINFTPLSAANIYEGHIGTMTEEGTFEAAIRKEPGGKSMVQKIKEKGFNAIEIMPLENTYSFNWGYDGVNKFAVREDYGGDEGFKKFLKHCHDNDISVIVDFVPNHIGTDGNYLSAAGPYNSGGSGWGESMFLEEGDNRYIRDFVTNMALNWLRKGADGIRADMTSRMGSDSTMKQIAAEVNQHFPDAFLIAEDERTNPELTIPLEDYYNTPLETDTEEGNHDLNVEHIMTLDRNHLGNIGFDSKWGFNLHHKLAAAILGGWKDDNSDMGSLYGAIKDNAGSKIVKYLMSHDEIGNHEGTRLIAKKIIQRLDLGENVEVKGTSKEDEHRKYQLGGLLGARLAVAYATMDQNGKTLVTINGEEQKVQMWKSNGELTPGFKEKIKKELYDNVFWLPHWEEIDSLGLLWINRDSFTDAFNMAKKLHRVGTGVVFATPGPKMTMQGNENLDLTPFRFFRDVSGPEDDSDKDLKAKRKHGYKIGKESFIDSKLSTLQGKYNPAYQAQMEATENYFKKLSEIFRQNRALQDGYVIYNNDPCRVNNVSKVLAVHAKKDDNEIFSIANFGETDFMPGSDLGLYGMKFPAGEWKLLISSGDPQYGGDGNISNFDITVNSEYNDEMKHIEIPAMSFMMFKKISSS